MTTLEEDHAAFLAAMDEPYPEVEEFDPDDWKVLFMLVCENRAGLDLTKGMTDHGKELLREVQRKIGIAAVGVDIT